MIFRGLVGAIFVCTCVATGAAAAEGNAGARWSGFYAGGHAGWGSRDVDWTYLTPPADLGGPTGTAEGQDKNGWLLGGHVGYQMQFNRLVAGVEVSFSSGSVLRNETSIASFDVDETVKTRLGSLFTATSRLGFLVDPSLLVYVKGGYATADVKTHTFDPSAFGPVGFSAFADTKERHAGWTIGGGFERALAPNLTIGVEYNYVDLGVKTHSTLSLATDTVQFPYALRVNAEPIHAVSVRLNLQLGGL